MAGSFGTLKVRNGHLYVAVSTEATLMVVLGNVENARMAEPSFLDGGIKFGEACEHRHSARCLILISLNGDNPSIATDDILLEDPRMLFHLGVQPLWHAVFEGIRAELCFLKREVSDDVSHTVGLIRLKNHPAKMY